MTDNDVVTGFKPEDMRVELPPVPDWFSAELARIAVIDGKPMFRCVDGTKETQFRNGKQDIKHLFGGDTFSCYLPVVHVKFRRWDMKYSKYRIYNSREEAEADRSNGIKKEIEMASNVEVRAIGWPCYIIEAYVRASEICEKTWNDQRYDDLEKNGIMQRIDILGPFPREGRYVFGFPVLSEGGYAIAPNQNILDECKKRWRHAQEPEKLAESIKTWHERGELAEKRMTERLVDSVYQFHGIAAKNFHFGAVSKPITKEFKGHLADNELVKRGAEAKTPQITIANN